MERNQWPPAASKGTQGKTKNVTPLTLLIHQRAMIHPDTELQQVNKAKGRGIFATAFIPKGTLTYVKDALEIEIAATDPRLANPKLAPFIETYSYIDEQGVRILSWDNAKYVNHCCHCNTISTGYGFEIAIRDIEAGEEITDEYGLFNFDGTLQLNCKHPNCRGNVNGNDIDAYYADWDLKIQSALQYFEQVPQPLKPFLTPAIQEQLTHYLATGRGYKSVLKLKV